MKQLKTKNADLLLPQLGLGCRTMADDISDKKSLETSLNTIDLAVDNGVNFLNTADFYNHGMNELLIRKALKRHRREDLFISVKFGGMTDMRGMYYGIDVRPKAVENYLCYTLKRLGTDYVDLYQPCRLNPHIPVEETIGAVARLREAGYVRHIGLSEIDGETLERAEKTCPISLVEVEYSFINRNIEDSLLPAARRLGVGVVGFNVLFNGVIGGRSAAQKLDFFKKIMRPEIYEKLMLNSQAFPRLAELAESKGATLAQLSMAWVMSQGDDVMALIGCRTPEQMENAIGATQIDLSDEDKKLIEQYIPKKNAVCSYMLAMNMDADGILKH